MAQRASSPAVIPPVNIPTPPGIPLIARRRFLRYAAAGAAGVTAAALAASIGFLVWPRRTRAGLGKVTVVRADIPAVNTAPHLNPEGRFYLVRTEDGLLALSWRCTHMGCRANWQGPVDSKRAFECPCHASTFDYRGRRTAGPARRPLDLMALRVNDDGSVTINTEAVSTRVGYEAGQAVAY